MKKRIEKPPVDNLFARKLANMSLPPKPDGFARLQTRMGRGGDNVQRVFWRNPTNSRYIAAAACLLVVCLFGWLYLSTQVSTSGGKAATVINKSRPLPIPKYAERKSTANQQRVAAARSLSEQKMNDRTGLQPIDHSLGNINEQASGQSANQKHQLATVGRAIHDGAKAPTTVPAERDAEPLQLPAGLTPGSQVATATVNPTPVAERVLVVTIAEPEALLVAHQSLKQSTEGKKIATAADKPDKDSKAVTLWQQVKRVKQGEIFARKDDAGDDRGLLGRAYNGIKQTFDKDKSAKQ